EVHRAFHPFGGLLRQRKVDPIAPLRAGKAASLAEIVDVDRFARTHGLPASAKPFFYNHHMAHALATLHH
ncbi:hypothetical protein, partial [Providencia stuartii]|uniref:hypothetical protein n=1 Tax=Providencia stuartii TaxID=588 RepID=UPI0013D0BE2B